MGFVKVLGKRPGKRGKARTWATQVRQARHPSLHQGQLPWARGKEGGEARRNLGLTVVKLIVSALQLRARGLYGVGGGGQINGSGHFPLGRPVLLSL